ncbi:NHLP leader peptide family RiPP precursor [Aquimarina sp. ERC-38]|uniref:NHLP leader peptide family RiPP precursor n=1 Tax=Aquimarina sp. ERC-38 TaxID=2949996 RepID=UPI00224522FA|nr:NHLP leader peptide family RiPP precursor [Aquimarina sp. ERC-38]UZO82188.1 NHLP leader peptide family RiPP precursor [Aquimarina sp. ERC-38]
MEVSKEQARYQQIINEAWENESFKQELIADPVAAIEALTGKKLNIPKGKTLVVRDQTAEDTVYINIPTAPAEDVELNEDQLEAVAGGKSIIEIFNDVFGDFLK